MEEEVIKSLNYFVRPTRNFATVSWSSGYASTRFGPTVKHDLRDGFLCLRLQVSIPEIIISKVHAVLFYNLHNFHNALIVSHTNIRCTNSAIRLYSGGLEGINTSRSTLEI